MIDAPRTLRQAPLAPAPSPAWAVDAAPGRVRLRGFLEAQPPRTHALLVSGTRVSAAAVLEDLGALARARGRGFAVVGPAALRAPALDRGGAFVPEELLERPEALGDRLRREQERGLAADATLLVAPSPGFAGRVLDLDAVLDDLAVGVAERYCLLPRMALRERGAAEALSLVQRHGTSFALA